MMKTKQIISVVMILFALGGVLALLPANAQAQTAPANCLDRLDFFYACQNSDWRPDGSQSKGVVTAKPGGTPTEITSLVPGRLDFMYAYRLGNWLPDLETSTNDVCASRLDFFYACRNGWQPGQ